MAGEFKDVRFLTVAEVATIMRVSKMTVYRLVHGGELPAVRVGRSFRVPEQAVHDYLRHSYVENAVDSGLRRRRRAPGVGSGVSGTHCVRPIAATTIRLRGTRGLRHQEAPQAHGEEEAPQAAEEDAHQRRNKK